MHFCGTVCRHFVGSEQTRAFLTRTEALALVYGRAINRGFGDFDLSAISSIIVCHILPYTLQHSRYVQAPPSSQPLRFALGNALEEPPELHEQEAKAWVQAKSRIHAPVRVPRGLLAPTSTCVAQEGDAA